MGISSGRGKKLLIGALVLVVLAVVIGLAVGVPLSKRSSDTHEATVEEVLQAYPLIDGHNDFPWQLFLREDNIINNLNIGEDLRNRWPEGSGFIPSMTDIPRLRTGKVGAQFWAAYVSCKTQFKDSVRSTIEQIDVIHRFVRQNSDTFTFVTSTQGIMDAWKDGKIGSLIGVEGGHSIDSSLGTLRMFYNLGVRYMTLTHNCHTPWADSCVAHSDPERPAISNGLSPFGEIVVAEMNRLGMMVDLSHVSQDTMRDALNVTSAPVIYSHSSAFHICNNFRNVPDDILELVAENGGVVMINYYPLFISCNATIATIGDVADHIDHIKDLIGVDHIGMGSDYDGTPTMPIDLEDVSTFPALLAEMSRRGWSKEDMEKVTGRNVMRAFAKVEQVRDDLAKSGQLPYEDIIPVEAVATNACRTSKEDAMVLV